MLRKFIYWKLEIQYSSNSENIRTRIFAIKSYCAKIIKICWKRLADDDPVSRWPARVKSGPSTIVETSVHILENYTLYSIKIYSSIQCRVHEYNTSEIFLIFNCSLYQTAALILFKHLVPNMTTVMMTFWHELMRGCLFV